MSDIPDSREWFVSNNIEISSTCFHLGVTDSGCTFYFRNVMTLS